MRSVPKSVGRVPVVVGGFLVLACTSLQAQPRGDSLDVVVAVLRDLAGDSSVVLVEPQSELVATAVTLLPAGTVRLQASPLCADNPDHVASVSVRPGGLRPLTPEERATFSPDTTLAPVAVGWKGFELTADAARVPVDFLSCGGLGHVFDSDGRELVTASHGWHYLLERRNGRWIVVERAMSWIS